FPDLARGDVHGDHAIQVDETAPLGGEYLEEIHVRRVPGPRGDRHGGNAGQLDRLVPAPELRIRARDELRAHQVEQLAVRLLLIPDVAQGVQVVVRAAGPSGQVPGRQADL